MAFDPTKPSDGTLTDAPLMRNQLNSLKALVDEKQQQLDAQAAQISALQNQTTTQQQQIAAQSAQISALQTQNTAQQTQLDAQAWLLNQLNVPKLNHDNEGAWSVGYIGTLPALWQVWVRSDLNTDWSNTAAYAPANFPVNDIGLMPPGAQWWQIYVCGSDSSNNPLTPSSNTVSMGPVPSP